MSFPLNLAMFSLLLFRVPTNYDFDIGLTTGVPNFSSNEYINESLLFESYESIQNNINGNVIETQLGTAALNFNVDSSTTLYFYRLTTSVNDKNGYIEIYELPNLYKYCIGGDTAGEGSDWFTGHVLNAKTGKQVARLRHQMDEDLYVRQMYCLGYYYQYKNQRTGVITPALMCIESNL